ncbi:hypothetical protein MTR67_000263 [Solanum verrucosum]|uniref:Pentatricopeptide repeat-containing protein n=1 Tax=Solanum verrucosum TaxID=315347 RepID=A0AAF0T795_SOLVR|nr:hypothetical protein MTR67_000263 [Solanum verrucosum]
MGLGFLMFSHMPYRDVYSWNSMIYGYMKNGCSEVAVKFFQRMMVHAEVKCGLLKPNETTFISIFSSCTFLDVCVALYIGRQVHGYMVKNDELSVFMTTALITFYGKMGCLAYASKIFDAMEAYDFIKKMPFEADVTVLGALMGACRLHGAIELGNEVSQLLLESQVNHLCWRREVGLCFCLEKSNVRCWNSQGLSPQFYLVELITAASAKS